MAESLFIPWQTRILHDTSRNKLLEKSRRIGGTWTQSWEDVEDCAKTDNLKVWFSSADLGAGREYVDYCSDWVSKLNASLRVVEEVKNGDLGDLDFLDEDKDITSLRLAFRNGSSINVLSSSPKAFRSKGGKVVWDEAAHHEQAEQMWKAAQPVAMWGYGIRVLSTHNGKKSTFYKLIQKFHKGDLPTWGHHKVTIMDAVADGMVDKLLKRKATPVEVQAFLDELRSGCLSEQQWLEEYMCEPVDESTAFLTLAMIGACERPASTLLGLEASTGPLYLGMDVGTLRDWTVIYVGELCGSVIHVRAKLVLKKAKLHEQWPFLRELLSHPRLVRACLDRTGLGVGLFQQAEEEFGSKVEGIHFTNDVKEEMAQKLRAEFEDVSILIPDGDDEQRGSLHSI
ncbi:MAG TPA: terminase family protein, partial [Fibrobacteria bacterium]|nr:terminase family protein [Fibrobacteria bacterium]